MISALNSAASGLYAAGQKFEQAATDTVRGGTQSGGGNNDLVDGLVSLKEAEVQFTASAKVFSAIARTEGRLLDILA